MIDGEEKMGTRLGNRVQGVYLPTLAATLSFSIEMSIFSFMASSYFFFSSRMVGSYFA